MTENIICNTTFASSSLLVSLFFFPEYWSVTFKFKKKLTHYFGGSSPKICKSIWRTPSHLLCSLNHDKLFEGWNQHQIVQNLWTPTWNWESGTPVCTNNKSRNLAACEIENLIHQKCEMFYHSAREKIHVWPNHNRPWYQLTTLKEIRYFNDFQFCLSSWMGLHNKRHSWEVQHVGWVNWNFHQKGMGFIHSTSTPEIRNHVSNESDNCSKKNISNS